MQTILLPTLAKSSYNSLTYLYRLKPGFASTSHACHCARLCGVPESVVDRADRICRVGLRAWHDSEAQRDEAIVRRFFELPLGNHAEGAEKRRIQEKLREIDDEEARESLDWVLNGSDAPQPSQG